MSNLKLEPFAATIEWQLETQTAAQGWVDLLKSYLGTLGKLGTQEPGTIIGHIKGITNLPEGEFIQVSVISPHRLPAVRVQLPEDYAADRLSFTLNFLVYGLSYQDANQIARTSALEVAARYHGTADFVKVSDPDQIDHHHHFPQVN